MVTCIEQVHEKSGIVTVILPEFVPAHLWELPLHNQTAWRLRMALGTCPNVAITSLRLHLAE